MKIKSLYSERDLYILSQLPGMGNATIKKLLHAFEDLGIAFQSQAKELKPFLSEKTLAHWNQETFDSLSLEWELLKKDSVKIINFQDPEYPSSLLELKDFPILLFYEGNYRPQEFKRSLAVIGTRNATLYGLEMAKKLSFELASLGYTIISGLARGIDTAAHMGALEAQGRTIAVMGSGLNHIYPRENVSLAGQIAKNGAVFTEYSPKVPPDKAHFPQRNRLVSGMSLGTLLVEAPEKSGAIITAEYALSQKKKVFALPGRADQPNFKGNHRLIKNQQALLIENVEDIIQHFETLFLLPASKNLTRCDIIALDDEEKRLLEVFPNQEVSLEEIQASFNAPPSKLNSLLMSLLIKKMIKEFPGKLYKKLAR